MEQKVTELQENMLLFHIFLLMLHSAVLKKQLLLLRHLLDCKRNYFIELFNHCQNRQAISKIL